MPTAHSLLQSGPEVLTPEKPKNDRHVQTAVKMYKNGHVQNLSPVEIIKRMYDLAIIACKKNDKVKANKVIGELVVGLDYSQGELPVQMFHLYQYCRKCIRENKLTEAVSILEGLRSAWSEAFNL